MIKTKTEKKKLTLSTQTLVKLQDNLTETQLAAVVGGVLPRGGGSSGCGSQTASDGC